MSKENNNFTNGISLLYDIFEKLNPAFTALMKKYGDFEDVKKDENAEAPCENTTCDKENCDHCYACNEDKHPVYYNADDITETDEVKESEEPVEELLYDENCDFDSEECKEEYDEEEIEVEKDDEDIDVEGTETVNMTDTVKDLTNKSFSKSYLSKISIKPKDDNTISLTSLVVTDISVFIKYTDEWMSDAFEIACSNNINHHYMYGKVVSTIYFEFYDKKDYIDEGLVSEYNKNNNVLAYPVWHWDPEMLSFYSEIQGENNRRRYVRMIISDNGKTCKVVRKQEDGISNGIIVVDTIDSRQRQDFIKMMSNIKADASSDTEVKVKELLPCQTDKGCNIDDCKKCPNKTKCIPTLSDYTGDKAQEIKSDSRYMYGSNSFVNSITFGSCNVIGSADSFKNKGLKKYAKGKIEKDIYLNRQKHSYNVNEFNEFVGSAIEVAIENNNYCYNDENEDITVIFQYKDIIRKYDELTRKDSSNSTVKMLGFTSFNEHYPVPTISDLKEYAKSLCVYLCERFGFVHVNILSNIDDYLIVCNY